MEVKTPPYPVAPSCHARVLRGAGRIPAGGFRAPQICAVMGKVSLSTMSCNVIPFFLRNVANYRMWLNRSADPRVLRDVGLCVCDDLEDALNIIDERGDAFERLPRKLEAAAARGSLEPPSRSSDGLHFAHRENTFRPILNLPQQK